MLEEYREGNWGVAVMIIKSPQNVNLTCCQHRYLYFILFPGKLFLIELKSVIYNPVVTVRLKD